MTIARNAGINNAVLGLDRWLDSMRVSWPVDGYGGPVVHWWSQSTMFTGAGLDWRYEGIIAGYLSLWNRTGESGWLDKAIRAGTDLLQGQLPDGHFINSQFESNPGTAGTPHEAACALGLLLLARALQDSNPADAKRFRECASRSLLEFHIERLWDKKNRILLDREGTNSFVSNKAATFGEAILLLADATNEQTYLDQFALPIAEKILTQQDTNIDSPTMGGIAQVEIDGDLVRSYFPIYIARCIPFLIDLSDRTGDLRFKHAAVAAAEFLRRNCQEDGSSPQVIYGGGRMNRNPQWIAGAGDIARAVAMALPDEPELESRICSWILRGVQSDGSIAAAVGFERIGSVLGRKDRPLNKTGVVGWCDKSFRYLAGRFSAEQLNTIDHPHTSTHGAAGQLVGAGAVR